MGKPVPSNKFDIRWNVQTNSIPPNLWVYQTLPTKFSSAVISILMSIGGFAARDQTNNQSNKNKDGLFFLSSDKTRSLEIQPTLGVINYEDKKVVQTSETNLPVDVPQQSELAKLTMDFLPKINLLASEIEKTGFTTPPEFSFFEPELTMYWIKNVIVTNIPYRSVFFRRSLDGIAVVGNDTGGNCWISFASHKAISKISLKWPRVERSKSYPTASSQTIIRWIRQGKSVHGYIPMDFGDIDWTTAKSMTITKAEACYLTVAKKVYPIASLWVIVDTGHGSVELEIDTPIIDGMEPKQLQ